MSTRRTQPGAWGKVAKGPNGRGLCRECGQEVPKGRRTFCGQPCVDAWVVKASPAEMRRVVFGRDRGVCAVCDLDTEALRLEFKAWMAQQGLGWERHYYGRRSREACEWLALRGIPPHRKEFWDADHVVPVVEGGGECSVDNIRTLCIPCHKRATRELARWRADQRRTDRLQRLTDELGLPGLALQPKLF